VLFRSTHPPRIRDRHIKHEQIVYNIHVTNAAAGRVEQTFRFVDTDNGFVDMGWKNNKKNKQNYCTSAHHTRILYNVPIIIIAHSQEK